MTIIITIRAVPASGQQKCIIDKVGVLKCYLKSPAQDGLANKELIKFFAKTLKIPQSDISIITGLVSRNKRLKIDAPIEDEAMLYKLLGLEVQHGLF